MNIAHLRCLSKKICANFKGNRWIQWFHYQIRKLSCHLDTKECLDDHEKKERKTRVISQLRVQTVVDMKVTTRDLVLSYPKRSDTFLF
ncbi:hypothetical protein H5410_011255 [Solanum commersonii]|uniref:Uncharacterized protein n=1 Tax=Solanum commersonii TaxID=4109 RepID=A0A9J6AN34_SOLCO|nr:hypothetical protein H5410_011255 [Solanum commersonii]